MSNVITKTVLNCTIFCLDSNNVASNSQHKFENLYFFDQARNRMEWGQMIKNLYLNKRWALTAAFLFSCEPATRT